MSCPVKFLMEVFTILNFQKMLEAKCWEFCVLILQLLLTLVGLLAVALKSVTEFQ